MARIEADMENVKEGLDRLHNVPSELATLKERVAHLPSKGFIITIVVSSMAIVSAIVALSDNIRALLR